jgi:hypothetical protein
LRALLFLVLALAICVLYADRTPLAGDPVHCTTREDPQFRTLLTTCMDGSRAVSKWDEQFKTWRTDITKPGPGEMPRGWDRPPVVRR